MAFSRSRRSGGSHDLFWPGYVDVLSTLLLVVTFLLSVFMVAQFYVSQELSGKDTVLRRLTAADRRAHQPAEPREGPGQDDAGRAGRAAGEPRDPQVRQRAPRPALAGAGGEKDARISALTKELADKSVAVQRGAGQGRPAQPAAAAAAPADGGPAGSDRRRRKPRTRKARRASADLGARLNVVLAKQVQELQRYRSDFFGRLRELLRDRKDIRVVGDRFVFESEVLFPSGQATMTVEGLAAIDQLATAIIELERSIPREIDWALQVDGHTDIRRIASAQFPSNWELSSARATSVVKYLIAAASRPSGWWRPATASSSRSRTARPRRCCAATAASS